MFSFSKKNSANNFYLTLSKKFSKSKMSSLISVEDAGKLIGKKNVKFYDIRDPADYEKSHINGSLNLNAVFGYLATSDDKGIKELKLTFEELFQDSGLNKKDQVILYEDALNTRFGASCRGWYILNLLGFNNVSVLNGGWKKWIGSGLPHDNKKVQVVQGDFEAGWDKSYWADKNDVLSVVAGKNKNTKLLDVRDNVEWVGQSSSPYGVDFVPRKGRLHGSKHILWSSLIDTKDGITYIKGDEEIIDILGSKGFKTSDDIIVYCFKGARASNTYLALKKAGFNKLRNYFGGWNEWSRDFNLPIDDSKL